MSDARGPAPSRRTAIDARPYLEPTAPVRGRDAEGVLDEVGEHLVDAIGVGPHNRGPSDVRVSRRPFSSASGLKASSDVDCATSPRSTSIALTENSAGRDARGRAGPGRGARAAATRARTTSPASRGRCAVPSARASPYPRIAVSGVRSSCDTDNRKFCSRSLRRTEVRHHVGERVLEVGDLARVGGVRLRCNTTRGERTRGGREVVQRTREPSRERERNGERHRERGERGDDEASAEPIGQRRDVVDVADNEHRSRAPADRRAARGVEDLPGPDGRPSFGSFERAEARARRRVVGDEASTRSELARDRASGTRPGVARGAPRRDPRRPRASSRSCAIARCGAPMRARPTVTTAVRTTAQPRRPDREREDPSKRRASLQSALYPTPRTVLTGQPSPSFRRSCAT